MHKLTFYQVLVIILTIFIFLFDGFDIAVITFASNPLAEYFQLNEQDLGILLGLDYVGVVLGSLLIAPISDRIGRRPTLLASLVVLTVGLYLTSLAETVWMFGAFRQLTGLAAGAILPIALSLGSEIVTTLKQKNMTVAILTLAGPFGGIIAMAATNALAAEQGWQAVFVFGSIMLAIITLISFFALPESFEFLGKRQKEGDLQKVNSIRKKMKQNPLDAFEVIQKEEQQESQGIKNILSPKYLRWSILLWTVFFLLNVGLQFIFKWTPKMLTKGGMGMEQANGVTGMMILGGILGVLLMGRLSNKFPLSKLTPIAFVFGCTMAFVFGSLGYEAGVLMVVAFLIGTALQAIYVAMNLSAVRIYDTQSRSTGTGWMMGIGKLGGVIGPILGGVLFEAGYGKLVVIGLIFIVPFMLGGIVYSFINAKAVREV